MFSHQKEHKVARMARVLQVSESGYYKWKKRLSQGPSLKEREDASLKEEIFKLFIESRGSFGRRKITSRLNERRSQKVNHKRVQRLMQEQNLYSKTKKAYVVTTDSKHSSRIADNLLKRDFTAKKPCQRLVSDTTFVATKQGYVYAAVILDLYGRMPLGLAMSSRNDKMLVRNALTDSLKRNKLKEGCILHSDRGATYASQEYQNILKEENITCSMSRKGDCWDNAAMESFFGKLKTEWIDKVYKTKAEAIRDIYEYVWSYYPFQRPHAALNYLTPHKYYSQYLA